MAAYSPPRKGVAYRTYIALSDMANAGRMKANPTIATGDFKVVIDGVSSGGGVGTNLATLPSVVPTSSIWVQIDLSASEMNGDNVSVACIDQTATAEWADKAFTIQTTV